MKETNVKEQTDAAGASPETYYEAYRESLGILKEDFVRIGIARCHEVPGTSQETNRIVEEIFAPPACR